MPEAVLLVRMLPEMVFPLESLMTDAVPFVFRSVITRDAVAV